MANPLQTYKSLPTWGKGAVVIGGAGVAYYIWKRKSSGGSGSQTGIDPVTGLPYSEDNQVDPLTGMTYLAEAEQYGSVSAAEAALAAGSGSGSGNGSGNGSGGGGGTTSGYGTNAQWAQAAEAGLSSLGYNPQTVAKALGRYLANLPVTNAEATIIYAAIAEYGEPPVGTYQVILQSQKKHHGHHKTDVVKMPDVVGDRMSVAKTKLSHAGLHVAVHGERHPKRAHWVHSQSPAAGHEVPVGHTVDITVSTKK